jgi:hypothetical protein
MMLMPHICWAIMTVKLAKVARLTLGMVNNLNREVRQNRRRIG